MILAREKKDIKTTRMKMHPTMIDPFLEGTALWNQNIPAVPKKTRLKIWREGYRRSGRKNTYEKRIPNPSKKDRRIPLRIIKSPNKDRFLIHEKNPRTDTSTKSDEPRVFSNNVVRGSLSYPVGGT
jgi:hypothetical protein